MFKKIKSFIFDKKLEDGRKTNAEIRTSTQQGGKEISYFLLHHPFYTRNEVAKMMDQFHKFMASGKTPKHDLVFQTTTTFAQRIKSIFGKK